MKENHVPGEPGASVFTPVICSGGSSAIETRFVENERMDYRLSLLARKSFSYCDILSQ
jgi:hypothetical protein